jgi:hypothetical protein
VKRARALPLFLLAPVTALALVACGDGEEAVPFESAEGRFRVNLPGKPERTEQNQATDGQTGKVIEFAVESGNRAYAVSFGDLPPASLAQVTPAAALDTVPEASLVNFPGRVTSKQATNAVGNPAIDYVIDGEGPAQGARLRARAVLVGTRLYLLRGVGKGTSTPFYDRMVSSFQLLPG